MASSSEYFFCGVGGSGMAPLAAILRQRGARVSGSDRALDQGRTPEKFTYLRGLGIELFPQDGSGLQGKEQILVASAAIEETVPDVAAALALGCERRTRAEVLSELFNGAELGVGVAGTSGKSTTTAMLAWIFASADRSPTVMNGAVMKNFATPENPYASALAGAGPAFLTEVDESDGSIALYNPSIAILTNVSEDHKSIEELRTLFGDFIGKASHAIINLDNAEAARLGADLPGALTFSLKSSDADVSARDIVEKPDGVDFVLTDGVETISLTLKTPGRHNVENALAAVAGAKAAGIPTAAACAALQSFLGVKRRFEVVGSAGGVTVIDDFAHNPDKIAATLRTLKAFPGRVLALFQPHGFGPLRLMKDGFVDAFAQGLDADDMLVMPQPIYFGGTVNRSVTSDDIVDGVVAKGRHARVFRDRDQCAATLIGEARPGDRIVIMGARDDSLSDFAQQTLDRLLKAS
ncbi:MAG: Mur ligase family protein [Pseudomonadota bacterium]